MKPEEMQKAYERLAMLHTETMAELVATRDRMDVMSKSWWSMLKYRIKRRIDIVLGRKEWWER